MSVYNKPSTFMVKMPTLKCSPFVCLKHHQISTFSTKHRMRIFYQTSSNINNVRVEKFVCWRLCHSSLSPTKHKKSSGKHIKHQHSPPKSSFSAILHQTPLICVLRETSTIKIKKKNFSNKYIIIHQNSFTKHISHQHSPTKILPLIFPKHHKIPTFSIRPSTFSIKHQQILKLLH